jgi:type VI secretion system protein ImpC
MLRLPYGKGTDPIESFPFAEQSSPPSPERYLWGSAGFALAELLAKSYSAAEGWDFEPGDQSTLDDLPLDFFEEEGEKEESPATQAWLTETKADDILKDGFTPLVAMKGRGEVRVPRIQSIASPPAALAGRWR